MYRKNTGNNCLHLNVLIDSAYENHAVLNKFQKYEEKKNRLKFAL